MDTFGNCMSWVSSSGPAAASVLPRTPAARVRAVTQMHFIVDLLFKSVCKEVFKVRNGQHQVPGDKWRTKAKSQDLFFLRLYLYLFVFLVGALVCIYRPGAVGSPRLKRHRLAVIVPILKVGQSTVPDNIHSEQRVQDDVE